MREKNDFHSVREDWPHIVAREGEREAVVGGRTEC